MILDPPNRDLARTMSGIDETQGKHGSGELTAADAASQTFDTDRNTGTPVKFWLAWAPISVLIVSMAAIYFVVKPTVFFEPAWLLPITNALFVTAVCFIVAYVAMKNYLATGRIQILLLGCGLLSFGLGGVIAGWVRSFPGGANLNVTIYNTAALLAAIFHFVAAFILLAGVSAETGAKRKNWWLGFSYAAIVAFTFLFALATLWRIVPPFFVQGVGPTALRQTVLGSADALFIFSFLIFMGWYLRRREAFLYWYASALALTAISLTGFFIESAVGSPIGWISRFSQYLGGIYFLIAVSTAIRTAHVRKTSIDFALAASLSSSEESFLRTTFDNMAGCLIVCDSQGNILLANDAARKTYGIDEQVPWQISRLTEEAELFDLDGRRLSLSERPLSRILRGEQIRSVELRLRVKATGKEFILSYNGTPIRGQDGSVALAVLTSEDITEHKQDESALQATLQRLYVILSSMYAAVLLVTDDGRVEFANQAFCECFGLKDAPADLVGLASGEMLKKIKDGYQHPDEAIARIKEVVDRGQPVTGEELAMHGGGTCLRDFVPLNIDGKSYGRLWIHTDITERDRAEKTLRERQSETVFATLADLVPQMVWMCTPDGLNIYFNQRWVEYTGLSLDESYGRGWNTPFHPDDKQAAWAAWNHAVQTGEEYRVESRLQAADGTYRWFLMRGAPLRNAAGEIIRWFGTCTDIEELKQAEQTLLIEQRKLTETVVNQLPCCVALVRGRDMTFQLINPGYQAIFSGQEILGKSLQVVWPGRPKFEELCRRVLETGVSYEAVDEPTMVSRSGGGSPESAYFNWSMHRVKLPKEDGWGLLITGWETTGRKQTEQALLRSEKLASVGRMAATIAHEINNPLEAVMSLLFLAKGDQELPESVRQHLEIADGELNRIAHITRQSLGFYRESNAPALTSVNAVLESTVGLLKSRIRAKQAVIEKQWDGDVGITAVAGELRQVFSNLLANSLDAIDEKGTIKLRVSLGTNFSTGRRCVRITVADNGQGIGQSSRQHIFEPFFTTKGTVGTGLGLWVSKQIVDKHGGTIRMRSSNNGERRGTVFSVVLPVSPAAAARSQTAGA